MAPASNEEQFKFLISCIRYSNNGKVDFGQVAAECNIVSKGAAAKRYERMMRAHGIAPNAATVKPAPTRVTKAERRDSRIPKKRKGDAFMEDNAAADDEETFASNIKSDPINPKKEFQVKEEHSAQEMARLALDTNAGFMQYMDEYPIYGNFETEPDYTLTPPDYTTPQTSYGYSMPVNDAYSYSPASMATSDVSGEAQGMSYQQPMQYSTKNSGSQHSIVLD